MGKHRRDANRTEVLEGNAKPGPRALVEMISEVNPTDRGLAPGEVSRRYTEKSALQSLLLRWYGEAFLAERTEEEDIVLLRHRHFEECACHARVSSLDDAGRAWVWENLESAAPASPPPTPSEGRRPVRPRAAPPSRRSLETDAADGAEPTSAASEAELIHAAEEALAAYDYENAERHLVAAFDASAGRTVSAARALLSLWVDVLGQDAQAVELAARLSTEVRADAGVQSLVGLAVARTGDVARALSIARGLEHPRAGEVWSESGQAALRGGDIEEARRCLSRARALGAAAESALLETALDGALRARASAEDARLEALVAAGDAARAEALARELLATGLASPRAQRLVREATARRTDAAANEIAERARAALAAGDRAAARIALHELSLMGRPDAALDARLSQADKAAEAQRDAEAVTRVHDALARASADEGIVQYLDLSAPLRARVRGAGPAALVTLATLADALDDAFGSRGRSKVPAAVVRVVELERLVEAGDAEKALAVAATLSRELDAVSRIRRLVERARATRADRLDKEARARLDTLNGRLRAGDWEAVGREGCAITAAHLRALAHQQALVPILETAEAALVLEAKFRRARLPGADLVALCEGQRAAELLAKLVAEIASTAIPGLDGPSPDDANEAKERERRWTEEGQSLQQALATALRFEAFDVPEGTVVDLEDEQELGAHAPDVRIACDAKAWFIASPEERCYVTEATLPDLKVTRRFAFSAGALRRGQTVVPVGDSLWVPLSDGGMIVLDRNTPSSVLDVWWGSETTGQVDDAWSVVAPDGSAVVLLHDSKPTKKERAPQLRTMSSGDTRRLRHCASVAFFGPRGRPRVLVTGDRRDAWSVLATDGTRIGGPERFAGEYAGLVPIAAVEDASEVATEGGGGSMLLAVDTETFSGKPDDFPEHGALYLVRATPELAPVARALVTENCQDLRAWLYRVGKDFLVVHYAGAWPHFDIFDGSTLECRGTVVGVRGLAFPIQDGWGKAFAFLERTHHGYRAVDAPTTVEDQVREPRPGCFASELVSPRTLCTVTPDAWARSLYEHQLDARLLRASAAREDRARLLIIAESAWVVTAFSDRAIERTTASLLLKMLWCAPEANKEHIFFHGAEHAVCLCPQDPEVVARLEAACELYEIPWAKAHALHLLGLAYLQAGRREDAVTAWRAGVAVGGNTCPFDFLIMVTGRLPEEARADPMRNLGTPDTFAGYAAQYEEGVQAMVRLDAALTAGKGEDGWAEAKRVREAVGPSWQLAARVALLHLEHPELSTEPWRRQLDLAWMASGAWYGATRNHMVFAGCDWDHGRLTEISKRAGAVLDAMGIGPAERPMDEAAGDGAEAES